MDNSFEIGPQKFKMRKVDALAQFHIVRRIGPLLSEVLPALGSIKTAKTEGQTEKETFEEFSKILSPIFTGLSKLSDEDANFVLFRLLGCVEVYQDQFNSWATIATPQGIKMQDIELPVLMQAAGRALMFNLSGFLALSPRKSGA